MKRIVEAARITALAVVGAYSSVIVVAALTSAIAVIGLCVLALAAIAVPAVVLAIPAGLVIGLLEENV